MFEGVSVSDLNILFYKFRSRLFFINHTITVVLQDSLFGERDRERERQTERDREKEGMREFKDSKNHYKSPANSPK